MAAHGKPAGASRNESSWLEWNSPPAPRGAQYHDCFHEESASGPGYAAALRGSNPLARFRPARAWRAAPPPLTCTPRDRSIADFPPKNPWPSYANWPPARAAVVIGEFLQRRPKPDPATLIGSGKLEELKGAVASSSPDLVIFDHELTPSQQRNLERELDLRVIDRTQLILDIFARHARTREGQLQVELAQLQYLLPRLAGRGVQMSQLGGGIGTRGPGETQLETDRRKIYRRIRHVKEQLENVRRIRGQQRQRRESVPIATVALVGYTNAGKSTLFNALTQAGRAGKRAHVRHARSHPAQRDLAFAAAGAAV